MMKRALGVAVMAGVLSGCAVKTSGVTAWDCYRNAPHAVNAIFDPEERACRGWRKFGKAMLVDQDLTWADNLIRDTPLYAPLFK